MEKIDDETKKILLGVLIGGVLGVCAASIYCKSKHQGKGGKSSISALGRVAVHVGELLTGEEVKRAPFIKDVEKRVHEHEDTIASVLDLISSGIHLWEKFK